VYIGDCGFFLTPRIGSWKVALRSAGGEEEKRPGMSAGRARGQARSRDEWTERTVGDVGLLVTERHRADEALHLYGLAGEALADKRRLGDHPLPALGLGLARLENLEHLVLGDAANLGQRHRVLCRPVLAALLDRRRERLGVLLTLAVEQVGRQRALGDRALVLLLDVALVVLLERLLELDLLAVPLGVVKLGLESKELLCRRRVLVDGTRLALAPARREAQQAVRTLCRGRLGGKREFGSGEAPKRFFEAKPSNLVGQPRLAGRRPLGTGTAQEIAQWRAPFLPTIPKFSGLRHGVLPSTSQAS
jgi:hypothetical protein